MPRVSRQTVLHWYKSSSDWVHAGREISKLMSHSLSPVFTAAPAVPEKAVVSEADAPRVTIEKRDDNIAVVTLNRATKYNALDMPMFEGIAKAALDLRVDRTVRAVILKGAGFTLVASKGAYLHGIRSSL